MKTTATIEIPTTFLDISFDVDAYLAKNGKLLELYLGEPSNILKMRIEAEVRSGRVSVDHVARVGRFMESVSKLVPSKVTIGSALSEDRLQKLWRESAKA
jgi:hypothetical protein